MRERERVRETERERERKRQREREAERDREEDRKRKNEEGAAMRRDAHILIPAAKGEQYSLSSVCFSLPLHLIWVDFCSLRSHFLVC